VKKSGLLLMLAVILLLSQTACEKKTVNPKLTHWDAVRTIISENPEIFQLGFFDTQSDTLFYREITESDADIEEGILVEEDTAHSGPDPFFPNITLTWGDTLKGKFHYRWNGSWREKAIKSISLTKGFFERWGDNSDPNLGWTLQKFSGSVISSVPTTKHPSILYVISSGVNDTITEPKLFALVKKTEVLAFGKGQPVTFIVEPASDTSDFIFLHVEEGQGYQKIPFVNNGDETLSASWTTTSDPDPDRRYYHAVVDIVSRESVIDTLAEYDSKAWGIIYKIQ
jgi:hypothetical protein